MKKEYPEWLMKTIESVTSDDLIALKAMNENKSKKVVFKTYKTIK